MIAWLSTPVGHFATHVLTAFAIGIYAYELWRVANRGDDTREIVGEVDEDVQRIDVDMDTLWIYVGDLARALYDVMGQQQPDDTATEQIPIPYDELPATDAMPTVESHAADMGLRKLATLHKGQHRDGSGGRTVDEILVELGLPHAAKELTQRQGRQ